MRVSQFFNEVGVSAEAVFAGDGIFKNDGFERF